jgi:choline-sulfatase
VKLGAKHNSHRHLTRRQLLKSGLYGGLAAAALAPSLAPFGCSKRYQSKRPNIIFILIDTLRADRTGLYGYSRDITPAIDTVAAKAVTFDRVIAQSSWTQPSVASLFCSRYPGVHKVLSLKLAQAMRRGRAERMSVFSPSFTTLAEVLRENGYETAGFIANFLMSSYYGFDQGFDLYADMPYRNQQVGDISGDVLNKEAITWLQRRKTRKPFFLYMHYMDVHGPYYSRPEFHEPLFAQVEKMPTKHKLSKKQKEALGYLATKQAAPIITKYNKLADYLEFWSAFYDAGVREVDQHIAELIADLKDMDLLDDSYVIITADHGEELQEHGYWSHGYSLHHTELHVPLIMHRPGVLPAGKRIKEMVRLIDIMPTLLDELGIPAESGMQGRSFKEIIAEDSPAQSVPAFSEAVKKTPQKKSLYLGNWKLIATPGAKTHEFYNIADDPLEQKNIYTQYPTRVRELAGLLTEQMTQNHQLGLKTDTKEIPLTTEQYERLKSLGYVQ